MKPLMQDDVEFKLGMTVVFWSSRELITNEQEYIVEQGNYSDKTVFRLMRKNGFLGQDISLLFSSQQTRIECQVRNLEIIKEQIDKEIECLQQGHSPAESEYLKHI